MASKFELNGIEDMLADIRKKLGKASSKVENKALRNAGQCIADEMKSRVNRTKGDKPHIQDDIKVSGVRKDKIKGTKYVLVGGTKKTNWRWHFLEYGTSKSSAKPFVEPAFHEKKGEAKRIIIDEFRKGLQE